MNTLKIEIPEGFEVTDFNKTTGEVKLQKKATPRVGRIKTFEEVCKEMDEDPIDYVVDALTPRHQGLQRLARILLICECFQEGTALKVHNTDQRKWTPWYNVTGSGFRFDGSYCTDTGTCSVLGPLLTFPDEKTSDYVGQTFIEEFKQFQLLNNN